MAIKFNKFNVTDGTNTARVTYSAFKMVSTGEECVTLYAKSFQDGRTLALIADDVYADYVNDSDICSDYFEKGLLRIKKGHELYEAAYARAKANGNV